MCIRDSYRPPSEEAVREFERQRGVVLPDNLREWLLLYGQREDTWLNGLTDRKPQNGIPGTFASYGDEWPRSWIPVAGDGCGCYYILDLYQQIGDSHPVFFWDHETDWDRLDYIVASGIWPFLRFYLLRAIFEHEIGTELHWEGDQLVVDRCFYWPFERDSVLRDDPQIADYAGPVPFPWDEDEV